MGRAVVATGATPASQAHVARQGRGKLASPSKFESLQRQEITDLGKKQLDPVGAK
ncbi:hypothetical protein C2845_PM16G25000 [Panicum miliaceum]|uniref:Uncharacterized protein n=1 Tax=Panicum miliaceum TaxID=4540 RepID=A0A3L6PX86_PANMI|nr:hypothetical protein C2845_PM16G25000 [Panicum miliaceum]